MLARFYTLKNIYLAPHILLLFSQNIRKILPKTNLESVFPYLKHLNMIFSYFHVFDSSLTFSVILISWQILIVFDAI